MSTPTSSTEIANMALRHLKVTGVSAIDPPDTGSKNAAACAFWYDQARRAVLEDHPWNFATKRSEIAADATAPTFEYTTRYELPSDFIRVGRIGEDWDDPETDYEIEGGYILCDVDTPLQFVYVYNLETVSRFSPKFIEALAFKLATLMAYELTGNATLVEAMAQQYEATLQAARTVDGQNRPTRRVERSRLKAARMRTSKTEDWRRWET